MITHIKHNVGTEEICKKLNEVIRVVNEGVNPSNIQCDMQLLINTIEDYGTACYYEGNIAQHSGPLANNYQKIKIDKFNIIKGMLGIR